MFKEPPLQRPSIQQNLDANPSTKKKMAKATIEVDQCKMNDADITVGCGVADITGICYEVIDVISPGVFLVRRADGKLDCQVHADFLTHVRYRFII